MAAAFLGAFPGFPANLTFAGKNGHNWTHILAKTALPAIAAGAALQAGFLIRRFQGAFRFPANLTFAWKYGQNLRKKLLNIGSVSGRFSQVSRKPYLCRGKCPYLGLYFGNNSPAGHRGWRRAPSWLRFSVVPGRPSVPRKPFLC